MKIQTIYYTDTLRTQQSLYPFTHCFHKLNSSRIDKAPQTWEEGVRFGSKYNPFVLLCHHTTIQICAKQFQISLSRSSHSSVIILERTQEHIECN